MHNSTEYQSGIGSGLYMPLITAPNSCMCPPASKLPRSLFFRGFLKENSKEQDGNSAFPGCSLFKESLPHLSHNQGCPGANTENMLYCIWFFLLESWQEQMGISEGGRVNLSAVIFPPPTPAFPLKQWLPNLLASGPTL